MQCNWNKEIALEIANTRVINYSDGTLCAKYKNPLGMCESAAQAIRLYKNCISWALLEKYPTKEELLCVFSKDVLAENGVYIDTTFRGERIYDHICCVFINCNGNISTGLNLEKQIIPMIYLSYGSDMKITVDKDIICDIPVELYYNSRVSGEKLSVKDFNGLTAKDNVNFSDEELSVEPNLANEDL